MIDYEKPATLKLNEDVKSNFDLFRQEVDLFFTATKTKK